MIKSYEFIIDKENKDLRIDVFLSKKILEFTRSSIKKHLKKLLVNNKIQKLSYKCKENDKINIEIEIEENSKIIPEDIPVDIVYEDDNYIIVNKKAGMVVHPAKGNWKGTLVNALYGKKKLSDIDNFRPGIVHRLDKDTSGLIIIAKNNLAHNYLQKLFRKRRITKQYKAIVKGFFAPSKLTIKNYIGRNPKNRKKMCVVNDPNKGKLSITKVIVIKHFKNYSYLNILLKTGRTHQIRVHLSNLGYPIVGDKIYSRKDNNFGSVPLCLVSYKLKFFDKFSNKIIKCSIKNPAFFNKILKSLKN